MFSSSSRSAGSNILGAKDHGTCRCDCHCSWPASRLHAAPTSSLLRSGNVHPFPVPCSAASGWHLEMNHNGCVYTTKATDYRTWFTLLPLQKELTYPVHVCVTFRKLFNLHTAFQFDTIPWFTLVIYTPYTLSRLTMKFFPVDFKMQVQPCIFLYLFVFVCKLKIK